jgi:uncharacterized protein
MSTAWVTTFLDSLRSWAESRSDVAAVVLVGSHARGQARADSDVDVVVLTSAPQRYLTDMAWVSEFGPIDDLGIEEYGAVTSVRARYRFGLEVEFGFASPTWASLPLDEGTRRVLEDGMHIVFDRDGGLDGLSGARS